MWICKWCKRGTIVWIHTDELGNTPATGDIPFAWWFWTDVPIYTSHKKGQEGVCVGGGGNYLDYRDFVLRNQNNSNSPLTLKWWWWWGVPMDPKISFRVLARKRKISWRCPFLTLYANHPAFLACVWKKKIAPRVRGNCVRVTMDPRWPPTGRHSTKIIFHIHVTFDL